MDPASLLQNEDALASLGVTSTTLTVAQRHALDERGYLVLSGVVDAEELDRLRSAFDRACDAEGIPPRGTRHPKGLLEGDPAFSRLVLHPGLLAAVLHVLGRPFRLGGVAGRDPMPGFGPQGLHMDCVESGPATPYQVVTALGLIDDFTPENGATRLVPGTHRWRRPPPKTFADPASRHPDQVVVTAPAGSVLAFNGHLWHGGTANRSGDHRRAVQCSFLGRESFPSGLAGPPGLDLSPAVGPLLGIEPS
jgi:ectoine hydroxylase-related dioxygenase (phytanoyl-CoA dioxygenase family)